MNRATVIRLMDSLQLVGETRHRFEKRIHEAKSTKELQDVFEDLRKGTKNSPQTKVAAARGVK